MRLVDIDKHFELNEAFYKSDVKMPLHTVKAALENTPIVEAIPIEWLKKQVKDGWYDIIEIMYHWELENNIKKSILWSEEDENV